MMESEKLHPETEVTKSAGVISLDFYITKASQDPESGEMRWACTASDTEEDLFLDEMDEGLFQSFLSRIEKGELVPEPWQSEWWQGGMPYLSVSHYSDGNGKLVPGEVQSVYMDGRKLKAKGTFKDSRLGKAAFGAVKDSYKKVKSGISDPGFKPVRISVGFLDYAHEHKATGYLFERKSIQDICPECIREMMGEVDRQGLRYLDGQLIHLALTREPVNQRTMIGLDDEIEVNKSMTTRKEDAASIVGEDNAEEIEQIEQETIEKMKKPERALVTKSEEPDVVKMNRPYTMSDMVSMSERYTAEDEVQKVFGMLSDVVWNITFSGSDEYPTAESMKSAVKSAMEEAVTMLKAKGFLNMAEEIKSEVSEPEAEAHILDSAFEAFKSQFDALDKTNPESLASLQESINSIAEIARSQFTEDKGTIESEPVEEAPATVDIEKMVEEKVNAAVAPLIAEMKSLADKVVPAQKQEQPTEVRRGLTVPVVVNDPRYHTEPKKEAPKPKLSSLSQIINRSVGLPDDQVRPGATVKSK